MNCHKEFWKETANNNNNKNIVRIISEIEKFSVNTYVSILFTIKEVVLLKVREIIKKIQNKNK